MDLVRESILSYLGPKGSWSISHERASAEDAFFYSMLADRIASDVAFRVSLQNAAAQTHRHVQDAIDAIDAEAESGTTVPADWSKAERSTVPADWARDEAAEAASESQAARTSLVA